VDELNPVESEDAKEQPEEKPKLQTNQKSYSKTDPDASTIRRKDKPLQLAYK